MKTENISLTANRFTDIREVTMSLVNSLEKEDFIIQSHPDVSPPKWHLAHTTWFFERFILKEFNKEYKEFNPVFDYLFNSYYETVGPFQPRHQRGVLSKPTIDEVKAYRNHVDQNMLETLTYLEEQNRLGEVEPLVEIGLQHEQQHQELILMDVKYNFFVNPLHPSYTADKPDKKTGSSRAASEFIHIEGGLIQIGDESEEEFSFDNERPRHKVWLDPYKLASCPVTNGEYMEFIDAGGYSQPQYWLSDGWNTVKKNNWQAPLYWLKDDNGNWKIFTLSGLKEIDPDEPVCHVSFYEADAYSRWKGKRLPTEAEWELAASRQTIKGNTMDDQRFHPTPCNDRTEETFSKIFGDVWEWTSSPYTPYPRSKPLEGALGEYNAKFMCNQMVLRGGACVTPLQHIRKTYRNFFPPDKRWQFGGIRLAEDAE